MSLYQRGLTGIRRFYSEQRGAFAVSFVLLGSFLLSMASFGLEGSRYISEKARLSDAMEQASLALSAEDNGDGSPRNQQMAINYFQAYMRHDVATFSPNIIVLHGTSQNNSNLSYVEYRVSGRTLQNSWLYSTLFPNFGKQVMVGNNGAARKYRSNIDVIFVTDFSGSMNAITDGYVKIDELKRIVLQLSNELFSYKMENKVGFTPFGWGTRSGDTCTPQFVSNGPVPSDVLSGEDFAAAASRLESYINIAGTVAAIPNPVTDIQASLSNVPQGMCLSTADNAVVPLTDDINEINQINNMTADGGTLVSSGVLLGAQELAKGTASRKVMVIVSDGTDDPADIMITPNLLQAGMCDKIRTVLSTEDSVGKIAFIAIGYKPTVDWTSCVGANNFFEPNSLSEFEDALRRAVFEEVGNNTLKD